MNGQPTNQSNAGIDSFLNPASMLTPGLAGGMTMLITNAIASQFTLPAKFVALAISFTFGLLVLAGPKVKVWQRIVYYILNSLIIFSVAMGSNHLGKDLQVSNYLEKELRQTYNKFYANVSSFFISTAYAQNRESNSFTSDFTKEKTTYETVDRRYEVFINENTNISNALLNVINEYNNKLEEIKKKLDSSKPKYQSQLTKIVKVVEEDVSSLKLLHSTTEKVVFDAKDLMSKINLAKSNNKSPQVYYRKLDALIYLHGSNANVQKQLIPVFNSKLTDIAQGMRNIEKDQDSFFKDWN